MKRIWMQTMKQTPTPWSRLWGRGLLFVWLALLQVGVSHAQFVRNDGITDMGFNWSRIWLDIDGDGKDDFCALAGGEAVRLECYFSDGSRFGPKQAFGDIGQGQDPVTIRWADVNGDGRPDFCRLRGNLGGAVQGDVKCWLGPTFSGVAVSTVLPFAYADCNGSPCSSDGTPTTVYEGINNFGEVFLADVDADGRADLCYVVVPFDSLSNNPTGNVRCRRSRIAGTSGTFAPDTEAWVVSGIKVGKRDSGWPRGFYDFNGDGFADFCRIDLSASSILCALGGANGFTGHAQPSTSLASPRPSHLFGAAFADINGDGKSDFCRYVGSSGNYQLACRISNGVGWEETERLSPVIPDNQVGDKDNRWWVDINADGLPDFCRLNASTTTADAWDMLCRLSRGDGDGNSAFAFGYSDIAVRNVEIGLYDGGRGFCDAVGNGVQTFCRMAVRQTGTSQFCFWGRDVQYCWPIAVNSTGLVAGLGDAATPDALQARHPLLTSYSDGTGAETRITYLPMTDPAVYVRSGTGSYPLLIAQPRAPIVYETRAWRTDGSAALTGNARYLFKDLRADANSGSRGFRERWIFTEGSNTLDHVVHFQGLGPVFDETSQADNLREIGLVRFQERFAVANGVLPTPQSAPGTAMHSFRLAAMGQLFAAVINLATQNVQVQPVAPTEGSPFLLLQRTANTLDDTLPVNPRYRYIGKSVVQSWDWNGNTPIELPQVETTTKLTSLGNVESIVQVTKSGGTEWSRKTTTNTYADNTDLWLLGRLKTSKVVSTAPTAAAQLAANGPRSAGTSPGAGDTSSTAPTVPQPISPAALSAILQLLLED